MAKTEVTEPCLRPREPSRETGWARVSVGNYTNISAKDLLGAVLFSLIVPVVFLQIVVFQIVVRGVEGPGGAMLGAVYPMMFWLPTALWSSAWLICAPFLLGRGLRSGRIGYSQLLIGTTGWIFLFCMGCFALVFADPLGAWPIALQNATLHGPTTVFILWQIIIVRYPDLILGASSYQVVWRTALALLIVAIGQWISWPIVMG